MKKILFALFILFSLPAFSQRIDKPGEPYYYFVEVEVYAPSKPGFKATLWFNGMKYHERVIDENGEEKLFKDYSDLINYFTKRGWEFVQKFDRSGKYFLLLKKLVTSDEQAKEFILVKNN